MKNKFLKAYIASFASYGFYRGWIADYRYNPYSTRQEIQSIHYDLQTDKYVDKLLKGILNGFIYGSYGNPIALYKLICRAEIYIKGKDPYQFKNSFTEVSNCITLPPKSNL